jgi:ATP-dependent 26S proteasome regulatory subunit
MPKKRTTAKRPHIKKHKNKKKKKGSPVSKRKLTPIEQMLFSPMVPVERRLDILRGLLTDPSPEARTVAASVLENAGALSGENPQQELAKQYADLIREMQEGPLRHATFIEMLEPNGHLAGPTEPPKPQNGTPNFSPGKLTVRRALVMLDDGSTAYPVVPSEDLARCLHRGDRVVIETKGRAILYHVPSTLRTGEEAVFERRIDERHVEVTLRGQERSVFLTAEELSNAIASSQISPGTSLVVNARQFMAYRALPLADGYGHYRFLVRGTVPDVIPDRDIGSPPACIRQFSDRLHLEMTNPDLLRRYRLRRSSMKLLAGASGSGKTLAAFGIWHEMYRITSEVTGTPVDQLPPRVFRLNLSEILSKWLGESDKMLDRFFGEIEQLAAQQWTAPDGRKWKLPVLAIMEEIDGLARTRGHEPVYDRILTNALQRLDPTRPELREKLIFYLGTTNEPQNIDRAFLRRIGGTIETFGRLTRTGFPSVLDKHLRGLLMASHNGCTPEQIQRQHLMALTDWLYSRNSSEPGLVEIVYAGSTNPVVKYRRDFLTGALVDRAVQQAAEQAAAAHAQGRGLPGVSLETLQTAFADQIRAIVEQLTESNASAYLDIPSSCRVATLRKLPQPDFLPIHFQRH